MDFILSKVFGFFTGAGSFLTLMSAIGVLLLWQRRHWRAGRAIVTVAVLLFVAVGVTPLQPWLTGQVENRFPPHPPLPDKIDGIIVLGGAIRPEISEARGRPTFNDAAERIFDGAHLAALHPEAKLVFTGGSGDPWQQTLREAPYARQALLDMGVPPERLAIEDNSRNTYENALFTRQMLSPKPGETWVLVTSALHMPRSVGVFRHVGWQVIPWPVNYLTGGATGWVNEDNVSSRLFALSRTFHEMAGMVYYRLRGWTDTLFPG